MNLQERAKMLASYAENPLVLDVQVDSVEDTICTARHFLGFGFSKSMPYYAPGTILVLPSSSLPSGRRIKVTGLYSHLSL